MQIKSYIVNPGDNLTKIAAANGTTVEAILSANANIIDPNVISVGQQLNIPGQPAVATTGVEILDLHPEQEVQARLQADVQAAQAQQAQIAAAQQAAQLQAEQAAQAEAAKQAQEAAIAQAQAQAQIAAAEQAKVLQAEQAAQQAAMQQAQAAAQAQAMASAGMVGGGFIMPTGMNLETVYKIVAAEGGSNNPQEAVNILSTMINRARNGKWGSNDLYKIATAPNQYVVFQTGRYLNSGLSPEARAACDALLAQTSVGGATPHLFQSFRSNGSTGYGGTILTPGGNRYKA